MPCSCSFWRGEPLINLGEAEELRGGMCLVHVDLMCESTTGWWWCCADGVDAKMIEMKTDVRRAQKSNWSNPSCRRTKINFVFVSHKNVFLLCWYSCYHEGRILQQQKQEEDFVIIFVHRRDGRIQHNEREVVGSVLEDYRTRRPRHQRRRHGWKVYVALLRCCLLIKGWATYEVLI